MAKVPPEYRDTLWYADPESGQLIEWQNGQETGTTGSLLDISGGSYSSEPYLIRESATGRFAFNIGANYPTFIKATAGGDLLVYREGSVDELNSSQTTKARWGVEGTFQVVLPDGTQVERTYTSWLMPPEDRLVVAAGTEPGTPERYKYASEFTPEGEPIPTELPIGWEWADQFTVMNRGLIGRLMKKEKDLLQDMVAMHMTDENGKEFERQYDAAAYLARQTEAHPTLASILMS